MTNDVYEWCDRCQCMTAQVTYWDNSNFCACNVCGEHNQIRDEELIVECPECEYRCDGIEPYRDSRDSEDEDYHTKKYECPKCWTLFEIHVWE